MEDDSEYAIWRRQQKATLDGLPVFDRGSIPPRTLSRVAQPALRTALGFSRNDRDARPGTPVPCGEPHPDRLAIAEAIRQQLLAQEARYRIGGATEGEGPEARRLRGMDKGPRKSSSQTPDIPEPLGRYYKASYVAVIARRDGRELIFASPRAAVTCLTGKPATLQGIAAVTNAAKGVVRGAYGWTWERVGWAKRTKLRHQK